MDRFLKHSRRGASGLTYGILVGLISVVAITAIVNSGAGVNRLFGRVSDELRGVRLPTPVPTPPGEVPLYAFTSFTFDTCGTTGRTGPASTGTCTGRSPYSAAGWTASTSNFQVSGGIQQWTVPATGTYRIEVAGASGGSNPSHGIGRGAIIRADFALARGAVLQILIGQQGATPSNACDAGSGGGSFVVAAGNTPLVIAGGGSGASANEAGRDGVYTEAAGSTFCTGPGTVGQGGPRGSGSSSTAGGGGGFNGNGVAGAGWGSSFGYGFLQGGAGSATSSSATSEGGFGGGGGGHGQCYIGSGGGGGYSGGPGGSDANTSCNSTGAGRSGGGGGSFSAATAANRSNVGYNGGAGYVTITRL